VFSDTQLNHWAMPAGFIANGIGAGEGNLSANNRYVALHNTTDSLVLIVDMFLNRVGSPTTLPDAGRPIGNVSISPSGRYVDVKYRNDQGYGSADEHRIFEVDTTTLAITPHTMASSDTNRCGGRDNAGWIFPLKHADMAVDPSDGNADVIIGGRACSGSQAGRVLKVRLSDGLVTWLSNPTSEASFGWASCRNTALPGWVYVTYDYDSTSTTKKFNGEVVAYKTDGSLALMRLGKYYARWSGLTGVSSDDAYRSQPHAVPSPTGTRILFASDWNTKCTVCGSNLVHQDYVIDARLPATHAEVNNGERGGGGGGRLPEEP
jgi:hypothetical protein